MAILYQSNPLWEQTMKPTFLLLVAVLFACAPANQPPSPPPAPTSTNPVFNGGFEQGDLGWKWFVEEGGVGFARTGGLFRTGRYCAFLGGVSSSGNKRARAFAQQIIEVPRTGKVMLVYHVRINTQERLGSDDDSFGAYINGSNIQTIRTNLPRDKYTQYTFDLADYRGKSIDLKFESFNDNKADTGFCVDDVSIEQK
jgi:zinc metalloprotease ZmpA